MGLRVICAAVVAISSLAATIAHSQAQVFDSVIRVVDGDTIVLGNTGTVRLIGVDTPETKHPRQPVQRFGREAGTFLANLLQTASVRLEFDQTRKDRYGRTLAYVYLLDGTFVNKEIVRQGYGHAYVTYPFRYMDEFRDAEREARENGRGLWSPER
jgi:micrococcal nuclease